MKPLQKELKSVVRDTARRPVFYLVVFMVIPTIGSDDVPVTALPIVRTSQVPAAPVDEEIQAPVGHYHGPKPIGDSRIDPHPASGPLPEDLSGDFFPEETVQLEEMREVRDWPVTEFYWQATEFHHYPPYFDQPDLEVCGRSAHNHLQPLLSGARFFLTIPLLPVKTVQTPPHMHISTLGLCRPGSPDHFFPQTCESDCCGCSAE